MNKTQLTIIARNFLYYDVNAETGNDIAVWGIGHEKCFPDKHEGPKIMQCYSLHLILKGSGTLIMKGETYQIHQGQIFVISPNEEVEYTPERIIRGNTSGLTFRDLWQPNFVSDAA